MKHLFVIFLLIIRCHTLHGAIESITVTPNIVHIGEPITLTIQTNHPKDLELPNLKPFDIINQQYSDTHRIVTLAIYELGEFSIPNFIINGQQVTVSPNIKVTRENTSSTISPLLKEIKLPKPWSEWIGILVIALLFFTLLYWLIMKQKNKKKIYVNQEEKQRIPATDLAIFKLKKLRFNPQKKDLYFLSITEILKEYLNKELSLNATELTSSEIITAIIHKNYSKEHIKRLRKIFEYCDTIKFYKSDSLNTEYATSDIIPFLLDLKDYNIQVMK